MPEQRIIFKTLIGSHVWAMNDENSDKDYFSCYVAPVKDILRGTATTKSYFEQDDGVDVSTHEAEKVVEQLLKGNINFLIGVLSPYIDVHSNWHRDLVIMTRKSLSKNCYNSIHGLGLHNYKKYIESKKDNSERRCNKISRALRFGTTILEGNGVQFTPVKESSPKIVLEDLEALDQTYEQSELPAKPDEEPFRDWLYLLRRKDLEGWESE